MRNITRKDLEDVFLVLVMEDKKHRKQLPFVRRHFRSVVNICRELVDRNIEIFYSGILVATKKQGSTKIVMDKEYRDQHSEQPFIYEVRQ